MPAPNDAQEIASFVGIQALDETLPRESEMASPASHISKHLTHKTSGVVPDRDETPVPLRSLLATLHQPSLGPQKEERKKRRDPTSKALFDHQAYPLSLKIQGKARSMAVGCALACVDSRLSQPSSATRTLGALSHSPSSPDHLEWELWGEFFANLARSDLVERFPPGPCLLRYD
ncbi:hypothetical protein ACJZ2D_009118 [Fusarium nematophilum]